VVDDRVVLQLIERLAPLGYLAPYVRWGLYTSDAPAAYHLGVAFSHLAAVAPTSLHSRLTVPVHANLYILIVGESAFARKTTSIKMGDEILRAVVPDRLGREPKSVEGMFKSLARRPHQVFQFKEFGRFLASSSGHAATNYMAKVRTALVDVYDGESIEEEFAKKSRKIIDPRLTVVAACAPPFLERYTNRADYTGGYIGRHMIIWAQRTRELSDPPVDTQGMEWLTARLSALYENGCAHQKFPYIGMSTSASEVWVNWNRRLEVRFDAGMHPDARTVCGRLPMLAMKLALLIAMDEGLGPTGQPLHGSPLSGDSWWLNASHIQLGIDIAEALHLTSTLRMLDNIASNNYERTRVSILQAVGSAPRTKQEIMQRVRPKLGLRHLTDMIDSMVFGNDLVSTVVGVVTFYHTPDVTAPQPSLVAEPLDNVVKFPEPEVSGTPVSQLVVTSEAVPLEELAPDDGSGPDDWRSSDE